MSARRVAHFLAVAILVGGCTTEGGLVPEPPKAPSGGEPLLAPIDQLKPDTTEASLFDWRSAGIPYVGVWAAEPAGCARIDLDASYPTFAVVTVKTLRQGTLNCAIAARTGTEPVDALCQAAGTTTPRTFNFTLVGDNDLTISEASTKAVARYVRCRLP